MWNWSNIWQWRGGGQIIFRVIFSCVRTWYYIFRVKLVSDLLRPNTKRSLNVCIYCSVLSSKIMLGGTSWYMKPMPVVFLFIATRDSFSNIWNYFWNPCLVRERASDTKAYKIYVSPPFLHWFWWYISTLKVVKNNYLSSEFFRKEWEYHAQIFVNISHGFWDW